MSLKSVNAKQTKEMIDKKEFDLIIDLRDKECYEDGNIEGSINIPMNEIGDKMDYLDDYKESKILLYCGMGHLSKSAGKILIMNGFKMVYTLSNGIKEYKM